MRRKARKSFACYLFISHELSERKWPVLKIKALTDVAPYYGVCGGARKFGTLAEVRAWCARQIAEWQALLPEVTRDGKSLCAIPARVFYRDGALVEEIRH